MPRLTCQISMSLDGFAAGPHQSLEDPIGMGGEHLHEWAFAAESREELRGQNGGSATTDADVMAEAFVNVGAVIMGRHMFGGGEGQWDESWRGWWGEDPPFHVPTFVLTHHARDPLPMHGGTTFHFVTDGIESALAQASATAGDQDITIGGGAETVQQYLAAGLLDELHVHVVPVLPGSGERLFGHIAGAPGVRFELLQTVGSNAVSHLRYRVVR